MSDPRIFDAAARSGLYRPELEHDACGIGMVADLRGRRAHAIVADALTLLGNLEHRGAINADGATGDGAGILLQIPDALYAAERELPDPGAYGTGMFFLYGDAGDLDAVFASEGLEVLGWRDVPVDPSACGPIARASMPRIRQVFVARGAPAELERRLFVARRKLARLLGSRGYVVSLSSRTVVYKGLLAPRQLRALYPDLADPRTASALALVHGRFSTNTLPAWHRAHPYRVIAHNGEINTIRGNASWMRARERALAASGAIRAELLPIIDPEGSDSAMFDDAVELLLQSGRSLPHVMAMMIRPAWERDDHLSPEERAFHEYHACLMEPWDGPAAITFSDGRYAGVIVDRNGLRPARWSITTGDRLVVSSEAGALELAGDCVLARGRVGPGRMLLVDIDRGRLIRDVEIRAELAERRPYRSWLERNLVRLDALPVPRTERLPRRLDEERRTIAQKVHGYTLEDLRILLAPMAAHGKETVGSMGNDAPIAVLSERPQLLFAYFRQIFAQVTNPPIDPHREHLVMSLESTIGAEGSLLEETPEHCHQLALARPVISALELARIKDLSEGTLRSATLPAVYRVAEGGAGLDRALDHLCAFASAALADGTSILILSDRGHNAEWAPIPSLLATAAVHHHLVREGTRTRCGLVVESGEPREVAHFALLVGYGAGAVQPYLACETVEDLTPELSPQEAVARYLDAANNGLLKVMSKMGISTIDGYRGAQLFEAIGLSEELVERCFTGTATRLAGIGLEELAQECALRHAEAHGPSPLPAGGLYQWRGDGERHLYTPDVIAHLQHAVRSGRPELYEKFRTLSDEETRRLATIRGLLELAPGTAVPIAEVEPASEIVRRFKTGAMSLGSISREAHETLAIAMNRLGARSNTGEGGEDLVRLVRDANGDSRRSAIKQVASARFGVTIDYLASADELQIKIAQGAKPGEGGQLPGHKVDEYIARLRYASPGIGLISPPPHHDIYSIEDLAQLIFDLRAANPKARISVKLVSEVGVGTIAAGVAKAGADIIAISGDSGGTGAAPLGSIKHAGAPWELGVAEAHQVLVANGLRGRVRLETDGQLKTGRDVAIAVLLGADEVAFATAALVASGCVMMRACHLNTCPVGIATQDPELRRRFEGKPEHVVNMMMFIAEDLRRIMAELGFRSVAEMVGRTDRLRPAEARGWKARKVDLSRLLHRPQADEPVRVAPVHQASLDDVLIARAAPALERGEPVRIALAVSNRDRAVGTALSGALVRARGIGAPPLDAGTIRVELTGSAGQSFGAFLAPGIELALEGEANDYFGKGLSGGRLIARPPFGSRCAGEDNVVVGNVALYGATGGEVFVAGVAGERFAVRNSGATAVVEGTGDHGCEYMTRGTVLVLGDLGRNFAAGMTGGVAYVFDHGALAGRVNLELVALERPEERAIEEVRGLIQRHYAYTRSVLAWRLLARWKEHAGRLVRVMPVEYRRALAREDGARAAR